jgi:hypothetical protein
MWRRRLRRLRIEPPPTPAQHAQAMILSARIGISLGVALGVVLLGWWFSE